MCAACALQFNFGLHDLETAGPTGPFAVPPANYTANLASIWERLAQTGAKVIWCTTTPVLFQTTPNPCKYCRNESSVVKYNALALEALTAAAAKTPATPLRVNDLYVTSSHRPGLAALGLLPLLIRRQPGRIRVSRRVFHLRVHLCWDVMGIGGMR